MRQTTALTLILITVAALLTAAVAQVDWNFSGRVDTEFGVSFQGDIPVARAGLELVVTGEIGSGFFPDAAFEASLLSSYDAATSTATLTPGTAWLTLYLGDVDLTVGQQLAFWGSTDGVNPVDVLNPRDLTFPLEASKLPVPMLRATWYALDTLQVEAVVIPVFIPSTLPGEAWRSGLTPMPQLPPGVKISQQRKPMEQRPATEFSNVQFGVRATTKLDNADLSVSYFHGFHSQPTLEPTLVPLDQPGEFALQPVLHYSRIDMLGVDFSGSTGAVVLRGEIAYTFTADPDGLDPQIENPYLQAVFGGEYVTPGGLRVVLQSIFDWQAADAGGSDTASLKLMTALSKEAGKRTKLDLAWLADLDGSGVLTPKAEYTFADGVTGQVSVYLPYGATGTTYGDWSDNKQLRVALTLQF